MLESFDRTKVIHPQWATQEGTSEGPWKHNVTVLCRINYYLNDSYLDIIPANSEAAPTLAVNVLSLCTLDS